VINLLLIIILFLGIASSFSFSTMSMTADIQKMSLIQTDKKILDQWEMAIVNSLKPLSENQELVVPYGINDETDLDENGYPDLFYHTVPAGYGLPRENAYGRPIIYCPFSDKTIPASFLDLKTVWTSTSENNTNEYNVGIVKNYDGREYVAYADQSMDASMMGKGVIAVLISPRPGSLNIPKCQDVIYNNETSKYEISNAQVRVISKNNIQPTKSMQTVVVNTSDNQSLSVLNDIVSTWMVTQPTRLIINLDDRSSGYTLSKTLSFINGIENVKEILINGSNSSNVFINASTPMNIEFNNIAVSLKGITFGQNVKTIISGGSLSVNDVNFSGINISNSIINIIGDATFDLSANIEPSILVTGSSISQNNTNIKIKTSGYYGFEMKDTKWVSNNGSVIFEANGVSNRDITLSKGSRWIADSTSISFNSSVSGITSGDSLVAIDNTSITDFSNLVISSNDENDILFLDEGQLNLNNVIVGIYNTINTGVYLSHGGTISLENNSQIGSPSNKPVNGITDRGGKFLFGLNSKVYASLSCWSGNLFTSVLSNTSGCSLATVDSYKIFNQSNWSCN